MKEAGKQELLDKLLDSRTEMGKAVCLKFKAGPMGQDILPALNEVISQEFKRGNYKLIFDLSVVEILLSSHLGVLWFNCQSARKQGGDFKLACLSDVVREVFTRVGFHKFIEIHDTAEKALEAFK